MTLEATLSAVPEQVDGYLRIDPRPHKEGTYAGRPRQLVELTNVAASPARTGADRYDLGLTLHSENTFKKAPTQIFNMKAAVTDLPPTINRVALESFPAAGNPSVRPVTVVDYLASSTTTKVKAELENRVAGGHEGTFERTDVEVDALPVSIHADITSPPGGIPATEPGETVVNYTSSSSVPLAAPSSPTASRVRSSPTWTPPSPTCPRR